MTPIPSHHGPPLDSTRKLYRVEVTMAFTYYTYETDTLAAKHVWPKAAT